MKGANQGCMPWDSWERLLKYCKLKGNEKAYAERELSRMKGQSDAIRQGILSSERGEETNESQEETSQEKGQIMDTGE